MSFPFGQIPRRASIANITQAIQCEVTTIDPHPYVTGNLVRFTDLNSSMPILRGMDQLNNNLYAVVVSGVNTFLLMDYTTNLYIDSTGFTPYVTGGNCNLDNSTYIFHGGHNG